MKSPSRKAQGSLSAWWPGEPSRCLPAAGRGGPTTAQPGCSRRVGGGKGLGAAQRPQARGRHPRGEPSPGHWGLGSSGAWGGVGGPRTTAVPGPVGVLSVGSCRAALSSSRLHAPLPFTSFRTAARPPPTPPRSWLRSNAAPRSHPATSPWAGAAQSSPVQPSPAQRPPLTPLADPLALPQGLEVVGVPSAAAVQERPARARGRVVGVAIEEPPARAVLRGQVADVTLEHGAGDESRTLAAAPAPAQQGGSGAVALPSVRGHAAEAAAREAALFSAGTVGVIAAGAVARE